MITKCDWSEFTTLLELESKIRSEKMTADMKKHTLEMCIEQGREISRAYEEGRIIRSCYRPFIGIAKQSYPKTVEGCMDWVIQGRPIFAKKLKVKSI